MSIGFGKSCDTTARLHSQSGRPEFLRAAGPPATSATFVDDPAALKTLFAENAGDAAITLIDNKHYRLSLLPRPGRKTLSFTADHPVREQDPEVAARSQFLPGTTSVSSSLRTEGGVVPLSPGAEARQLRRRHATSAGSPAGVRP
jgi:hypothetical protein